MFILRFFVHFLSLPCYSVTLHCVSVASIGQKVSSLLFFSGHTHTSFHCVYIAFLKEEHLVKS